MKRIFFFLLALGALLALTGCQRKNEDLLAYQDSDFSFTGCFLLDGMECKASFTQTTKNGEVERRLTYLEPEPLAGFSFRSYAGRIYASYGEDEVELHGADAAMRIFSLLDIPDEARLVGKSVTHGVTEAVYSTDGGSYTVKFKEGESFPFSIVFTGREFGASLTLEK